MFLKANAYDRKLYTPLETRKTAQETSEQTEAGYLAYLYEQAVQQRDVLVRPTDRLILLSTCASGTDERSILVGRITEECYKDPFEKEGKRLDSPVEWFKQVPLWAWMALAFLTGILILFFGIRAVRKKNRRENEEV